LIDNVAPANADTITAPYTFVLGDWERFQVVDAGGGSIALRALSVSKYAVAWANILGNPLLADFTAIGDWEKLQWIDVGGGFINLRANSNGNYILARADEPEAPLRANSTTQGDWEKFSWGRYVSG
jgi:hypothetical protein